jgi:tRNA threonylcarbamoyl adenosine modification protein (Sua5/YciO/YrdC/YwlC family)
MVAYVEIHPQNPQQRLLAKIAARIADDALIAYPTDSGFALGCRIDSSTGAKRISEIRDLDKAHHYTLVCADLAQASAYVRLDNPVFRAMKSVTPGPYTFIVPATREVPKKMAHPKKYTVGVRIPNQPVALALLAEYGAPILSSTLIMPGEEFPVTEGWVVQSELGDKVDVVVDGGEVGTEPTTVVNWTSSVPAIARIGSGDPDRF